MIIKVALPLPLNTTFSYLPPEDLPKGELRGRRVLVPLHKKLLTGIIIDTADDEVGFELKKSIEILDEEPTFNSETLEFTKWISEYYLCSWGEALKAAMPQGMSGKSVNRIKLKRIFTDSEIEAIGRKAPKQAELIKFLEEHEHFVSLPYIESKLGRVYSIGKLESLAEEGIIEIDYGFQKEVKAKTARAALIKAEYYGNGQKFQEITETLDKKAPSQSLFLSFLYMEQKKKKTFVAIAPILKKLNLTAGVALSLQKKGIIEIKDIELDRSVDLKMGSLSSKNELKLELNAEQKKAYDEVIPFVDKAQFQTFLLSGATSSGKTLVYLKLIEKVIASGRTALVLVPEIAITPQLIDRFNRAFPNKIACINSSMSAGEKFDSWRRIKSGKAKVALGARSAVFAPLSDIGIIIVDEEHETSYKQDSPAPRYQARDAAIVRAKLLNVPIVLGSAAPSIESMHNAQNKKYKLLTLSNRADGALFPEIKIIDMLEERKKRNYSLFSNELKESILQKLEEDNKIILFQNRRGFSSYLECPDCGAIPMCRNCAVTLTYHKNINKLKCHYCGYTEQAHKQCQTCGHPEVKLVGAGSQKIEQEIIIELEEIAPYAKVGRLDADSVSKKGAFRRIIEEFASGKTNILVGTQMASKGLDIEKVALVGMVNADLQLFLPDFRAYERTFQQIIQVSGRAGRRKDNPGAVIIQTSHADNYIIKTASEQDYASFYETEIENRREALYPPFTRFIKIEFSSKEEQKADSDSRAFARNLPIKSKAITILGPIAPFIPRLKGMYRRLIIIKNIKDADPSGRIAREYIRKALDKYYTENSSNVVKVIVDVDSYSGI